MRPPPRTRLSALVVSYRSGAFALACAESLVREWRSAGRAATDLEIVVVDNASPDDQEPWLARLERLGARVLRSPVNGGYSGGAALALAASSGGPDDVVALLNADVAFLEGSLEVLLEHLRRNVRAGACAPRAFVDPAGGLQLPRHELPTPAEHARSVLARLSPRWARPHAARRARRALAWWEGEAPLEVEMLSGACLFLTRRAIRRAGGLLDPGYPLYYEDTDLCRRLRRAGLTLTYLPAARIVHHWARSTGVGEAFEGDPLTRYEISRARYSERWHSPLGRALVRALDGLARAWPADELERPFHRLVPLGPRAEPFELDLGRAGPFAIELALSPTFSLAAGALGSGERFRFEPATWEWLFQARYWVRALTRPGGELLGAWTFDKTTPALAAPRSVVSAEAGVAPDPRGEAAA